MIEFNIFTTAKEIQVAKVPRKRMVCINSVVFQYNVKS